MQEIVMCHMYYIVTNNVNYTLRIYLRPFLYIPGKLDTPYCLTFLKVENSVQLLKPLPGKSFFSITK